MSERGAAWTRSILSRDLCDEMLCGARPSDEASFDIFWLKDESLADSDNLPPPEVIAQDNTPPAACCGVG
jgi:hypothetical protein